MIPNWKSLLSFDVFSCPSLCSSSSFFSFTFNSANLFLISFSFSLNFSLSSSNLLIINLSFVGFGTLARKCDFPLTKDIDLDCLKGLMNFCWTLILKFWELISCHFFLQFFLQYIFEIYLELSYLQCYIVTFCLDLWVVILWKKFFNVNISICKVKDISNS